MSLSKLPSGRWRAQVWNPALGRNVSVSTILGPAFRSFETKGEAKSARELARLRVGQVAPSDTVGSWHHVWTTDPLYRRPKASTDLHNRERTKAFAKAHADMPLRFVDDLVVARWLAGGQRNGQVPALRAMFNDALSAKAGRLIERNPWANLGIKKSRGNKDKQPATEPMVWKLIGIANEMNPPFAAWLQVAAFTGMRPGELDSLRWADVDFGRQSIRVHRQFNANTRTFTTPKNDLARDAILTRHAESALRALRQDEEFCFVNSRGNHFTASARAFHWKAIRAAAGWDKSLYLATRHFFGSYAINVLLLAPEDVAIAMGHTDGGQLVRQLYGHRDIGDSLERVRSAFASAGDVVDLAGKRKDTA